ncbi:unnamed protein product [Clonostachys solani]|uniref:Uncharacterized protein n=1 Tax=Clonostachys solani TaxID=160281 RepID=A0A9N9VZD8_9HYPO|nr:unnamed protein product [Clonostachys solani]
MATLFLVARLMGGLMTKFQRYADMFERWGGYDDDDDDDDDNDAGKQATGQVESRESSALLLECAE